jgi:hypothetical protein
MYSVNFDKLRDENLPVILQTPVMQEFISVLQSVLVGVHGGFSQFKAATDIRLAHNGQVYLLRKILNDTFDPYFRRITIIDEVIPFDRYIGNPNNQDQAWLAGNDTLPGQFTIGNPPGYFGSYDFIVNIPGFLMANITRIRQIIDMYKLAGKTYQIKEL